MLNFLAKRILQLVPTLFFVSVLIFSLQHLLPGDPALVMAGEERDPEAIAHIRAQYRLDQPIPVQYVYWVKGVLSGDFGESLRIKVPVLELIAQKLPVTLQLGSMAIVIALLIGIPAGIVSAVKRGTAWDYGANLFALWGISTPNFWLGIMLIFLFSIELGWLPASGYVPLSENWRASLASTIMPAFVLGNAIAAILMRHTRSAMLQVLESDYVRTARAKGLSERAVILKHAMRNALTPVITLGALELGTLVRRGIDRADIFDSRLRQADRRCCLQPRLCRGARRGAGYRHHLHHAQFDCRRGLHPRQSQAEGLKRMSDAVAGGNPDFRIRRAGEPGASRGASAVPAQGRGRWACGDRELHRHGRFRAAAHALRSRSDQLDAGT